MEKLSAGEKFTRGLSLILTVIVAGTIFWFSAQRGTDSSKSSTTVASVFYMALHGGKQLADIALLALWDVIIRAFAHIFEYMVFSACVGFLVTSYRIRGQIRSFYMVGASFMLSVLDEALQTFVPGRYGDLSDIFADTLGAGVVAFFLYMIWRHRCSKHPVRRTPARRRFMKIFIDDIGESAALDRIMEYAADKKGAHYAVTPNADHLIRLEKDEEFLGSYLDADLAVPDGMPLLWIAASTGHPMMGRVTGADLFEKVCERAAKEKRSVFFLGGLEDTALRASREMKKKYRGLKVAGSFSPDPNFDTDEMKTEALIGMIREAAPDILFFCIGAPRSEIFLHRYRERLKIGVALPFGTAIDHAAGESKRAPVWMQRIGMEWFYRFLQEPGRLFHRYFVEDMKIFCLVLKYRCQLLSGGRVTENEACVERADAGRTDGSTDDGNVDGSTNS